MKSRKSILGIIALYLSLCGTCRGTPFFPGNSAYGILAALAIPLDLPYRSVFLSYNFESNYNLPFTWDIPPVALNIEDEDFFEHEMRQLNPADCTNCTAREEVDQPEDGDETPTTETPESSEQASNSTSGRQRRSLITRKNIYFMLLENFNRSGYKGKHCLLRLICEVNASELGEINGVLGSLLHVLFSPSTSKNEHLPLAYYQAEFDGRNDDCLHYNEKCSESLLDLMTTPFHEIMDAIIGNNGFY